MRDEKWYRVKRWSVAGALLWVTVCGQARSELVDAILATVDTEVILLSDVQAEVQPQIRELREQMASDAEFSDAVSKLIRAALEQAVESRILLREALLLGVTVEDGRIEDRIDAMRELYPTDEEFMEELAEAGESLRDFRERIRKQYLSNIMARSKLNEIEDRIVVSDEEIDGFYRENAEDFAQPEAIFLRQIFIRARDRESKARERARLNELRAEILSGADFSELAKAHSQMAGAEQGGVVGWHQRGELVEALENAAFSLEAGEVSEVIETPGGVTLLKVDTHRESRVMPLDEARTLIEPKLRNDRAQVIYDKWLAELRKRSHVQEFL